jgi:glucokinase
VCNLLDLSLVAVGGSVALGFGEPFFAARTRRCTRPAGSTSPRRRRWCRWARGPTGPLVGAGALAWRSLGVDVGVG